MIVRTEVDRHGSVYVYLNGELSLKTWPNGTFRVFQKVGRAAVKVPRLASYLGAEVWVSGVEVEQWEAPIVSKR